MTSSYPIVVISHYAVANDLRRQGWDYGGLTSKNISPQVREPFVQPSGDAK